MPRHMWVVTAMPSGRSGERLVDVADVGLVLVLGVAADRAHVLALGRVVEVGEARVVELQVGAAQLAETPDLLGVGGGQVRPERVQVGVERLVDRRPAAAVVDHARRRDRELRRLLAAPRRLQELERVAEDRRRQPDPVVDVQRRRRELDRALLVAELHMQRLVEHLGDAVELVDEVHVPRRAAELAVGHGAQARRRAGARPRRGSRRPRSRAARRRRSRRRRTARRASQQLRRAQQAADVVGAERRSVSRRHQIG